VAAASSALAAFEAERRVHARRRRRTRLLTGTVLVVAVGASAVVSEFSPVRIVQGLPGVTSYLAGTLPAVRPSHLLADLAEWYWGLGRWLLMLLDTVIIAFVGTLLGVLGALLLCFHGSSATARGRASYHGVRRALDIARTVPELVYALMFVYAFGLGPLAGVLAIAVHSVGVLGKLFAEVVDAADRRPIEGVYAAGAGWVETIRFAILPQVLPGFASYALLRFEINVRASAVIGFVGAGGIGQELYLVIRQFIYQDVSAIVLMIIAAVALIDLSCERLRHRVIGRHALVA
jgi:phosphonate transport system permease protein